MAVGSLVVFASLSISSNSIPLIDNGLWSVRGEDDEAMRTRPPLDCSSSKKVVKALNQHAVLGTMR